MGEEVGAMQFRVQGEQIKNDERKMIKKVGEKKYIYIYEVIKMK
jgi:hypothetical protein